MKTVLIIEDDPQFVTLLKRIIPDNGESQVVDFPSAENARNYIQVRGLPHLILLDINLPGENGLSFFQWVSSMSNVPVIIISSDIDREAIALRMRAYDFIPKSRVAANPDAIRIRLERALRESENIIAEGHIVPISPSYSVNFTDSLLLKQTEGEIQAEPLSPLQLKIIYLLLQSGRWTTTSLLAHNLWGEISDGTKNNLRVSMTRLRKKLPVIESARTLGYRIPPPPLN